MTIRVIQWATGPVGMTQLRAIIDSPELELVGVLVYDSAKAGVDAGTLCDRAVSGVTTTDDKQAILDLEADIVLHAASKAGADNTNTDDIVALLAAGKSVITTTSYVHLPTYGHQAYERIVAACRAGGSRFHAAGEHPGFMFERLATTLTALCRRVDCITVQEFVDCRAVTETRMLVDLMGMGRHPDEISAESAMFRAVSSQYEQSLAATADVLGLRIDNISHDIRTITTPKDIELACTTVRAGTVAAQVLSWTATRRGTALLVAEEYWTVSDQLPGWDVRFDGQFLVRVRIDGTPPVSVDLKLDNASIEGVAGGLVAVGMTAVRAIPYVVGAPIGVVVPEIFGAYRWPEVTDRA
jgi:hypothetical protein